MLCPERIAGHEQEDLIGCHLLHKTAGLGALSRVDISHAGILVGTEHAAGHLSESVSDQMMDVVGSPQVGRVFREHIISCRLPEALGDVHVVPVGQCGALAPVGRVTVRLLSQCQQEVITGNIVKPIETQQVIPAATVLPVVFEKFVIGQPQLPLEITGHQVNDPFISRMFVIGLQAPDHDHISPQIRLPVFLDVGAEVTILTPAFENCFNP